MELFVTTVRVHSTRVFALNVTVTFFFFTLQTNQNNFHFEKNFCTYFVSLQTLLRNLIYFATLMRRGVLEHCWCLEGMWIIGDTKYDVKLTLLVVIILCTLIVHVHCTADVQGRWDAEQYFTNFRRQKTVCNFICHLHDITKTRKQFWKEKSCMDRFISKLKSIFLSWNIHIQMLWMWCQ